MANVADLFYHGALHQIRRVITALGEERTDKGITAFEDGASNWSDCFFARALADDATFQRERNEHGVARTLGFVRADGGLNLVPVRLVYFAFDNRESKTTGVLTHEQIKKFIVDVRDESRDADAMRLLRSLDFSTFDEEKPVQMAGSCGA